MYFDKILDWLIVIASTAITIAVAVVWGILVFMLGIGIWYNLFT